MRRDAAATRARILDAACTEFAAAGHAGARIDRIAAAAECNVRMIYAYFGGKTALFDAAYRRTISEMVDAVPPRPDDLAAWAGEVYDFHERSPRALRLTLWAQLERPEAASEPLDDYVRKVAALADTDAAPLTGTDLLVLLYAIAQAWQIAPHGLVGAIAASERRSAVVTAAERLLRR